MKPDTSFWQTMGELVRTSEIIIARPRGTSHPRYADVVYPLDYGYVEDTVSGDGGGIDAWLGSLNLMRNGDRAKILTGILCTFDTLKRDAEIKFLVGCTDEDIQIIQEFHQEMATLYIPNPTANIQ